MASSKRRTKPPRGGPPPPPRKRRRARFILWGLGVLALATASGVWWYSRHTRRGPEIETPFTIYLLGSSTAYGFPYDAQLDLGKLVAPLLGGRIDGHPITIANLAHVGRVSREILSDTRDLLRRSPVPERSLAFVYPGNNEYARLDHRPDLRWHARTLFEEPVVTGAQQRKIEARYGAELNETFKILRDAGIPTVASTMVVNLKDWDPNRSVLEDQAHAAPVREHLEAGQRALESGDPRTALAHFETILSVEPHFALASKRAGDCCRVLGRLEEARLHFRRAVDDDGYPLRDTSRLDAMLRQACKQQGVTVLDAAGILNTASADSILGFNLLWDNCHPTFEGYALLARAFANLIATRHHVKRVAVPDSTLRKAAGLDIKVHQAALNREGQYCYTAAVLSYDSAPRLARARIYLERADALGPDPNVACSLAVLAGLEGHLEPSLAEWRRARQLDPEVTRTRMKNKYVEQLMSGLGVTDLAQSIGDP